MEEENRVVEQEQQGGLTPNCKNALIAFILAVVGFFASAAVVGFVLGIIALSFLKKIDGEVENQPFKTFAKIAKPVAIVSIILSAAMLVFWIVYIIVVVVLAAVAASEAAAQIALFLL